MKKLILKIFSIFVVLLTATHPAFAVSGDVHVLLGKFSGSRLSSTSVMTARQANGKNVSFKAGAYNVKISGKKLRIGSQNLAMPAVISSNQPISWNGRQYSGQLTFSLVQNGLSVGNKIDIEQYLCGVLRAEMSPSWHLEALKAQAVLARTYAIKNKGMHGAYDICDSIHCQAYNGNAVDASIRAAVMATEGIILHYGGSPANVYYHSDSGGMVTRAGAVWSSDFPYLQPRSEPVAYASPNTSWEITLPMSQIQSKLAAGKISVGTVTSLAPVLRDESGRVQQLKITGSKGTQTISGNQFRLLVGSTVLKSTLFEFGSRSAYNTAITEPTATQPKQPVAVPSTPISPVTSAQPKATALVNVDLSQLPSDEDGQIVWMTMNRVFTTQELMEILSRPEQRASYIEMGIARIKGEKPIPTIGSALVHPQQPRPQTTAPAAGARPSSVKVSLSMAAATGTSVTFYGRGYGHGVGLSQWGAKAMADNGWSYDRILMHYFPGTTIAQ